jgi:hypothetical protein
MLTLQKNKGPELGPFCWVRQAWRVARSATRLVVVAKAGDLEVKVLYTPGKGKC